MIDLDCLCLQEYLTQTPLNKQALGDLLVEEYIQLLDIAAFIIIWLHRIRWGECACVCENNVLRQMHCADDYRKKIELKGYFALHFENFYYICVTKLWESFFW